MANPRSRRLYALWAGLLLSVIAGAAIFADWWSAAPWDAVSKAGYVGGASCIDCHQQQHQDWLGSHHDRAMELATDESVEADFNNVEFERLGLTTRFFRDGEKFMVNTEGPDGEPHDYHVKYTFGCEPLQQFMVEFPDGRVQVLRVSWDTTKNEWFYVPPPDVTDERLKPGDPLHWTGIAQNWNTTCAICHSTNLQKNYDLASNTYDTTFTDIDVSCEECHGPGSFHLELANSSSLFWDRRHGYGLAKLKTVNNSPQIDSCAKCHSHRNAVHPDYRPSKELLDFYTPSNIHAGLYHVDGQIRDEVYVYGSFLQSRMFRENVRCTDCHNPHSLKLKFEGNALCAQCHEPAKYDVPAHHHHEVGTPGAACVECHMPATTYMVVDPRRDHSIRVPRPDLSVSLGTPNACNGCHTKPEEDAKWAANKVAAWFGPKRHDDPHWAPAFALAGAADPEGESLLADVIRRETSPTIIKATAVELLGQYRSKSSEQLVLQQLKNPSAQVRRAAVRSFSADTPKAIQEQLGPRLKDPVRSVRIETALRLVQLPRESFDTRQYDNLMDGLEEFREAQAMYSDHAAGHLNLGQVAMQLGEADTAKTEFQHAIRLEPYLAGPRRYLASILANQGDSPEEVKRLYEEEIELLERDTDLAPNQAQLWYELARLRVLVRQYDQALPAIEKACELDPANYRYWLMNATMREHFFLSSGKEDDLKAVLDALKQLQKLNPESPDAANIYQRMLRAAQQQEGPPPSE